MDLDAQGADQAARFGFSVDNNPSPGDITINSGGTITLPGNDTENLNALVMNGGTLSAGTATISIPAGLLAAGSDILTASYTPDTSSSSIAPSTSVCPPAKPSSGSSSTGTSPVSSSTLK